MSNTTLWTLGLLGLVLLSVLCLLTHAPGIERDLSARAAAVADGAAVAVSGRDVTLTGEVASEEARLRLLAAVRGVRGVRIVHDRLTVAGGVPADASAAFALDADGAGLVARGVVPSEAARAALMARLRAAFAGRDVRDALTVQDGAAFDWDPALAALLPTLGGVTAPALRVEGGTVVLRGTVPDDATRDRVEAAARAALLAPFTLRSELAVGEGTSATTDTTADTTAAGGQVEASGSTDADVLGAEGALREALSIGQVEFTSGTATLTPQSRAILDRAAAVFVRFPSVRAEVQGHTDSQGNAAANLALSQRRADAVEAYLVGKGVSADALTPRGFGADEPVADNATAEGRARNRRVVFRLDSR